MRAPRFHHRTHHIVNRTLPNLKAHRVFFISVALLCAVFLLGGGARDDIVMLPLVRLLAGLTCAAAVLSFRREHWVSHRGEIVFGAVVVLYLALQLVPLPHQLWTMLPGREAIAASDRVAGIGEVWRPFTLAPGATWNALGALLIPLAMLLCAIQLSKTELERLLLVVLVLGGLSALAGIVQIIGEPGGPFYFYQITNRDAAVGLFSNRNHHAIFLAALFPMLALVASRASSSPERMRIRAGLSLTAALLLLPLILVAGSRVGMAMSVVGLLSAALLYRHPAALVRRRGKARFDWRLPLVGLALLLVAIITLVAARAVAVDRLTQGWWDEEQRFKVWGPILEQGWTYFPLGSGIGSFVSVFQMHEPDRLLDPTYLNHAHNEVLELWLTGGVPALLLAALALAVLGVRLVAAWRGARRPAAGAALRAVGATTIAILLLGSIADYPLRTPSLAALFVLALVWLHLEAPDNRRNL